MENISDLMMNIAELLNEVKDIDIDKRTIEGSLFDLLRRAHDYIAESKGLPNWKP